MYNISCCVAFINNTAGNEKNTSFIMHPNIMNISTPCILSTPCAQVCLTEDSQKGTCYFVTYIFVK